MLLAGRRLADDRGGALGGVAAVEGRADNDGGDDENKDNDQSTPVGVLSAGINRRRCLDRHGGLRSPLMRVRETTGAIIPLV